MSSSPVDHQADLLALARAGDLAAFSQLMEELQPRLLGQALAFCSDSQRAQDLVQETMIAAWKSLPRFDGSCRVFTWLYVILLRQHQRALGWFSRRLPLATLEQQAAAQRFEPATSGGPEEGGVAEAELLRAMLTALPARHREVVRLRFYADASETEIAAVLGIPPGTVKSRLHSALTKLRRMKEKVNRLRGAAH
ncbi:MAG: RNA polymerase sigma factor [Chthoniobacter sp.]|uniref:RNA polymerase sigma factor n=1 Tax=Chthoniobacter sp. TaxID=2510640 RepID=UPI0032A4C252